MKGSAESEKGQTVSPEEVLLERAAGGDAQALAGLYDRFCGMLLGLATKILGNPSDAEDVLQEVFIQVWNQASRYQRSRSSVSTWLVLITRSRSIDRLRSRNVKLRTANAAQRENVRLHASNEGLGNVLLTERHGRITQAMQELPDDQRQALEMAYYQGMTQREIAEATGTPLGTVKTRTLLAMRKLRSSLKGDIEDLL